MFVSKRRWILKTCGTTTPLECLEPLLKMAEQIAGYKDVEDLFYSRKNFKRPELQVSPHRGFEEEVALLDSFFDDGRAYCLGSVNRDCWYLYTLSRGGGGLLQHQNNNNNNHQTRLIEKIGVANCKQLEKESDQTIEILMTELDPEIMSIFTKEECASGVEATEVMNIFYFKNIFMNFMIFFCLILEIWNQ